MVTIPRHLKKQRYNYHTKTIEAMHTAQSKIMKIIMLTAVLKKYRIKDISYHTILSSRVSCPNVRYNIALHIGIGIKIILDHT